MKHLPQKSHPDPHRDRVVDEIACTQQCGSSGGTTGVCNGGNVETRPQPDLLIQTTALADHVIRELIDAWLVPRLVELFFRFDKKAESGNAEHSS